MQSISSGCLAAETVIAAIAERYPDAIEERAAALLGTRDAIIKRASDQGRKTEMLEAIDRALGALYRGWAPAGQVPSPHYQGDDVTVLWKWALGQYNRMRILEADADSLRSLATTATSPEEKAECLIAATCIGIEVEHIKRLLGITDDVTTVTDING